MNAQRAERSEIRATWIKLNGPEGDVLEFLELLPPYDYLGHEGRSLFLIDL